MESGCAITAMRSCPEWELHAFSHATALLGKPLGPLGLLPPWPDRGHGAGMNRDDATVRWLDTQPPKSVVYVALGSEVPLRVKLVHELAHGLELAVTRFLWALRKPSGVPDSDVLPPGFRERTHGKGMVTMGHGVGSSNHHTSARRRRRVLDTLWPELAHRRASVWAPSHHAADLR
jgi:hypothetical protein